MITTWYYTSHPTPLVLLQEQTNQPVKPTWQLLVWWRHYAVNKASPTWKHKSPSAPLNCLPSSGYSMFGAGYPLHLHCFHRRGSRANETIIKAHASLSHTMTAALPSLYQEFVTAIYDPLPKPTLVNGRRQTEQQGEEMWEKKAACYIMQFLMLLEGTPKRYLCGSLSQFSSSSFLMETGSWNRWNRGDYSCHFLVGAKHGAKIIMNET